MVKDTLQLERRPESAVSVACLSLTCVSLRLQGTTSSTEPWYKTPYSWSHVQNQQFALLAFS